MTGLISTTPEIAAALIESGKRKIVDQSGNKVEWINLNNFTCFVRTGNNSGMTKELENVELDIVVPANAKTIF